jgi:hypothetical protein
MGKLSPLCLCWLKSTKAIKNPLKRGPDQPRTSLRFGTRPTGHSASITDGRLVNFALFEPVVEFCLQSGVQQTKLAWDAVVLSHCEPQPASGAVPVQRHLKPQDASSVRVFLMQFTYVCFPWPKVYCSHEFLLNHLFALWTVQ